MAVPAAVLAGSAHTQYTDASPWYPVLAAGLGVATAYDVGATQNFPIQNTSSDEFYNYSATNATQSVALGDIFIGVEHKLTPVWALQLGLDYNQGSSLSAQGTLLQGADTASADSYNYSYKIVTKQLSFQSELLYTFRQVYHPYVLAGLGVAFNTAYNYSTNASPFLTFTRTYTNNSNTSFSPTIGGGVDVDIKPNLRAGISYRFTDLGEVQLGTASIDNIAASGTLSQSHLYRGEILGQITWAIQ